MKKGLLTILILILSILCLGSVFAGVASRVLIEKPDEEPPPAVELPSDTEQGGLTVLPDDGTKRYQTHAVKVKITSARDDLFFITYQDAYGTATANWTDVKAGAYLEKIVRVVDKVSFQGIAESTEYRIYVDGVLHVGDTIPIDKDTVIELILL